MDAILLAAGNSSRFHSNKLNYKVNGKKMYRWMLDKLVQLKKENRIDRLIVVTQYQEIEEEITGMHSDITVIRNLQPEIGVSHSIHLGVQELEDRSDGCLFAVADQPFFSIESLKEMIWACTEKNESIIVPYCQGKPGNPVIFSSAYFPELLALTGDVGGRAVWKKHRNSVRFFDVKPIEVTDFDTILRMKLFQLSFVQDDKKHVVSVVGAGGKTSLIYALADLLVEIGKRVLITTTTHMELPPEGYPLISSLKECIDYSKSEKIPAPILGEKVESEKIRLMENFDLSAVLPYYDFILIEADGSKRHPCKAPADWEPVIPAFTDTVVAVAGMNAFRKPLEEVCFRREFAMPLLGVSDEQHLMTETDLITLLLSDQGSRKGVEDRSFLVVLNGCDTSEKQESAEQLKKELLETANKENISVQDVLTLDLPMRKM